VKHWVWPWRVLLAALALVTIFAQLDRASAMRPELSIVVPRPFRSFAQSTTAMLALATSDGATAQAEARRLVRRRPMPAEHLFTLAMAELRAGHPNAFAATLKAASTRGWRYPPLQVTTAQAALSGGDVKAAANRVATLWAEDSDNPSVAPLTKALLASPGGPEAFAEPLAGTRVWGENFVRRSAAIASPEQALRTVMAARKAGGHFDCGALKTMARSLEAKGHPAPSGALACD
jgi:hypothetical protein